MYTVDPLSPSHFSLNNSDPHILFGQVSASWLFFDVWASGHQHIAQKVQNLYLIFQVTERELILSLTQALF